MRAKLSEFTLRLLEIFIEDLEINRHNVLYFIELDHVLCELPFKRKADCSERFINVVLQLRNFHRDNSDSRLQVVELILHYFIELLHCFLQNIESLIEVLPRCIHSCLYEAKASCDLPINARESIVKSTESSLHL